MVVLPAVPRLALLAFLTVLLSSVVSPSSLGRCELTPPNYPEVAICTGASFHIIPNDLPPTLTKLDLSDNDIHAVDNTLRHYSRLTHLSLADNSVREVQQRSFASSSRLRFLTLRSNRLAVLDRDCLLGLDALVELVLADNLLESLPRGMLERAPRLERLDLSGNRLRRLPAAALQGAARGLQSLSLADNELERIPSEALATTTHLSELYLDDNPGLGDRSNGDMGADAFSSLTRLQTLSLRGCEIRSVTSGTFDGPGRSLRTLDLSSNRLSRLSHSALKPLSGLREIRVGLNFLEGLDFLAPLRDLETVVVNGCQHGVSFEVDGGTFADNLELSVLNITKCPGFTSLPPGTLDYLPFLRVLNLRENSLGHLPESAADWSALEHLDLTGNPFDCDCQIMWLDRFLEERPEMPRPACERPRELRQKVLGEGSLQRTLNDDCGGGEGGGDGEGGNSPKLSAGAIVGIFLSAAVLGAAVLAYCCGPVPSLSSVAASANASDDQKWTWRRRKSSVSSRSNILRKKKGKRKRGWGRGSSAASIEKSDIVVVPASVKDSSRYVDVIRSRETGLNEEAPPLSHREEHTPLHIYEELPPPSEKEESYVTKEVDVDAEYENSSGAPPPPASMPPRQLNFPDVKVSVL